MKNKNKLKIEFQKLLLDKEENLSDLAKGVGVSLATISGSLNGQRKLSADVWNRIAEYLDLSKEQLRRLQILEKAPSELITFRCKDFTTEQRLIVSMLFYAIQELSDQDQDKIVNILEKYC